ncbi:MAG TPA: HAD family hydrolase [Terriglobales bacterium]|jgi:putative hydrolase of the HAD superfamily|nr:HAD family hydrolase [Terriglobales bacterium]
MPCKPETVFFDVGNTLLFPNRRIIHAPLQERKLVPSQQLLHSVERRTKKEFDALQQNGEADHSFWYLFYTHLLEELGIADDALRDALVGATRNSANWGEMRPGTREALERIGERYRIGVISNADGKIAAVLEQNQIADCFLSITDSGLVGHEKPDPAIFQSALRAMQAVPGESLYVGDVYSVDYLGATSVGMQAMLFDVSGAYQETDLPRVESLEQLERRLDTR